MSVVIKYKLSDVAKDLNVQNKELIDFLYQTLGESKKHTSPLTEAELNHVFEHYTQKNSEASLDAYLASAPAPKVAEKDILKKADGTVVAAGPAKRKERIRPAKPEKENKPAPEKREVVTVTVDTRITDVNLDKFNEKYTELASTKNVENRRKPTPAGNKQKFSGRNNRRQQPFQKKRETEAERLQRIQLEKARKAQLKVSIPDEITVGELASRLKVNVGEVIKKLMGLGIMAAISEVVDFDTASLVAEELGAKVEHEVHVTIEERLFEVDEDKDEDLEERPPVVVVMGHVDHGKTTLTAAITNSLESNGLGNIVGAVDLNQVQGGLAGSGELQVIGLGISSDNIVAGHAVHGHVIVSDHAVAGLLVELSLEGLVGNVLSDFLAGLVISSVLHSGESGNAQSHGHDHSKNSCDDLLHVCFLHKKFF